MTTDPNAPMFDPKAAAAAPAGGGGGLDTSLFPDEASLNEANEAWSGAGAEAEKTRPIGTFQAEIVEATLGRATSSGRLQIAWKLRIKGGERDGIELRKYDGLGSAAQANVTQSQLQRLGIDTKKISLTTLPAVLLDLQTKTVKIQTKMNGNFYNIYFQGIVATNAAGVTGFAGAAASVGGVKSNVPATATKKF